MIRGNWVKKKLASGQPSLGSWITMAHPTVAEVMSQSGFDWLAIDMEHGIIGLESVQTLIQAMSGTPVVPLVRVPWNDQVVIKQVLETGAMGIVIPQIRSAQDVNAAIAACRYPPGGIRGIGCQRAAGFGAWFREYLEDANETMLVIVQIEHVEAIACLDEILAVKGLDAILIGANDLAASMGFLGQPNHPDVLRAIDNIRAAANARPLPVGIVAASVEEAQSRIAEGYQLIAIGHDVGLLSATCREICARMHWPERKAAEK